MRSLPPPLIVPVAIALFQIGLVMKVFSIAFVCIWPIALNAEDGFAGLHPTVLETARAYGLGFWTRMFKVVLPAVSRGSSPDCGSASPLPVLLLVLAEQLGSSNGIGWFVLYSQQGYDVPGMWAGILMLRSARDRRQRAREPPGATRSALALQSSWHRCLTVQEVRW